MKKKSGLLLAVLSAFIITSCEKEEEKTSNPLPANLHGVFVVNEGAFGQGNASISFASSDSAYYNNDIYTEANGIPAGDLLQSFAIHQSKGYLCVNNSQKIEVVSMSNFKKEATITGIASPRFFAARNNEGYVSDWATNKVYRINLLNNTITGSVSTGNGPEEMLVLNDKLYVCNVGGFGDDSTVTVINLNTFTVTDTIQTGVNPASIKTDKNGKIWIVCKGSLGSDYMPTPDDPGGYIVQLNPGDHAILNEIEFTYDQHPIRLQFNPMGDQYYFLLGSSAYTGVIYRMGITETALPTTPFVNRDFYSLGIHPTSGMIYAGKYSFIAETEYLRYTLNGTVIDSMMAGIGPNSFTFN